MKTNLNLYFTMAATLFFASILVHACSDNSVSIDEKEQLYLQASPTDVTAGDMVSFKVTANGHAVDADIYIDSSRIEGATYTFHEAGNHTAVAKKEGFTNSEKAEINVSEKNVSTKSYSFTSMYVSDGDVYVTGVSIPTGPPPNRYEAAYWKNGNFHYLGGNGIIATSVYATKGDVYITGYSSYGMNTLGVGYWKNGNFHELATSGAAKSIYIFNKSVYVTGYVDYQAKAVYWKNGTSHTLTDGTNTPLEEANGIYLSNSDVYVSGATARFGPSTAEFYWKNGIRHELSISGVANAMDVSDGNVYTAGYQMIDSTAIAAYWKNGILHELNEGKANFINVSEENVNVAGWSCDDAQCVIKYWKNGTLVSKYPISGSPALARSFVSNGDVYVVGKRDGKPFYWKNGIPHEMDITN